MEGHFGASFASVRVHTGQRAADAASGVSALAYTVGNDIVFGRGMYAPETASGRYLLAHELVHVVQDPGDPGRPAPTRLDVAPRSSAAERDADRGARAVLAGRSPGLRREPGSAARLRRACPPAPTGLGTSPGPAACTTGGSDVITGDTLLFCQDSDQLTDGQGSYVTRLSTHARRATRVAIHGYASSEGPGGDYNRNLSCKRAAAAAALIAPTAALVAHGPTSAFGPAASNRNVVVVMTMPAPVPAPPPGPTPRAQAITLADADCAAINVLRIPWGRSTRGLFLEIYSCLTCSFAAAFRAGHFTDPLWLARVNHNTITRLFNAFAGRDPGYATVFTPCDILDECLTPRSGLSGVLTAIGCQRVLEGTGPLTYIQLCTEGIGGRHLLVDLAGALRDVGCASPVNKADYAAVVPLFQACNRRILSAQFPGVGGLVADYWAIPTITSQRNTAWTNAGCP